MNVDLEMSRTSPACAHPIRVLLADDHAITLWGLRRLLESAAPRMAVSGTAATAAELLAHPALHETDVVLLDLSLGAACALDCLPQLIAEGLKVVVLTGDLNPARHRDAVMRGARGVVLKSQSPDAVLDALERVHAGEVCIDGSLMSMLLGAVPGVAPNSRSVAQDPEARRISSLTPKERQVIEAIVRYRGAKSLAVADALHMSEHTLRNHLTVIYSKLDVHGKINLYVYAIEHGLATPPVSSSTPAGPARGTPGHALGTIN
jgi:two-component system nitrate/nitrite response regulator NarL